LRSQQDRRPRSRGWSCLRRHRDLRETPRAFGSIRLPAKDIDLSTPSVSRRSRHSFLFGATESPRGTALLRHAPTRSLSRSAPDRTPAAGEQEESQDFRQARFISRVPRKTKLAIHRVW
jgi:hypothetical protein